MTAKPTWDEAVAWAQSEIEKARTALEAPGLPLTETEQLRARIVVMRELQNINQIPTAAAMPPPVPYA